MAKKRVRTQPSNPYYSNEPAVSRKLIADQGLTQNASLGNAPPKMVDKKPGRLSGLAGFADKHRPKEQGIKQITSVKPGKPPGSSKSPIQGGLKSSGHPGAHRLGSLKPLKLKV